MPPRPSRPSISHGPMRWPSRPGAGRASARPALTAAGWPRKPPSSVPSTSAWASSDCSSARTAALSGAAASAAGRSAGGRALNWSNRLRSCSQSDGVSGVEGMGWLGCCACCGQARVARRAGRWVSVQAHRVCVGWCSLTPAGCVKWLTPASPGWAAQSAGSRLSMEIQVSEQSEAAFDPGQVTQWLSALEVIEPTTANRLFEALYGELRRLARSHMRRESADHTLSATALAHEAWFRLSAQTRTQWRNRGHFLAVASTMMRRILVNHEQARRAAKRDMQLVAMTLSGLEQLGAAPDRDVVAVHEALLAFEAEVVELRFFGGLENEEVAEVLGVSLATVKRDWTLARAWLHRALGAAGEGDTAV
ncbi:MAG: hypothetical protein CFE45_19075 [Burkholderiales bacterium PBB5]|nr:MAG: hypothetical protein CFE45_19075 [Burkholderiales bacterium PBB5]